MVTNQVPSGAVATRRWCPDWALDSGGFTELTQAGRWTISAREYVAATARYDQEIGKLGRAACQDWMFSHPSTCVGAAALGPIRWTRRCTGNRTLQVVMSAGRVR